MSENIALIVGVSSYTIDGAKNLPFCKNDVISMEDALINGLKFSQRNIHSCGKNDIVTRNDFINRLKDLSENIESDDLFIFYFSGHGYSKGDMHYLIFSDYVLSTQEIINYIELIKAKTKIIILDSCFSGNFEVKGVSKFNINDSIADFHSKGLIVFSSSNSIQKSYGHPDKPISVFTNFLSTAMKSKFLIKDGYVTFYDITRFVSLYIELWNKDNPSEQQNPIYRGKIGGTVHFKVDDYTPYDSKTIFEEYGNYVIYSVKPFHSGLAKRYSVNVLLKEPVSLDEISVISKSIIKRVLYAEIYENKISEKHFSGKPANMICCYFGKDKHDIINNIFLCHTTWIDNKQDKHCWNKVDGKSNFMLNDVHFSVHSFYETLKKYTLENSGNNKSVLEQIKEVLSKMVSAAEKIIKIYNEYLNEIISEDELCIQIEPIISILDEYYEKSGNIEFAQQELKDFDDECQLLFATIHNLTLYYNKKYDLHRSEKNKKACMDMTIKDYYRELSKVKALEGNLQSI